MRDIDPTASEYISTGYLETSRPGRFAKYHDPVTATLGSAVIGGAMQGSATRSAANAQAAADAARLAEEKRVREQLRADTEAQRAIADKAFSDYQAGLIDYATAQQRAGQALQQVQQQIGTSQLSDVAKMQEMAQFKPYAIRTGVGSSFFDQATGQAGTNLSPEMQAMQGNVFGNMNQLTGNLTTGLTPEQQAYQQQAYGLAGQAQGNIQTQMTPEQQALQQQYFGAAGQALGQMQTGLTPEQQAYQQQAYGKAGEALGGLATTPEQAAARYIEQQQGLLNPQRQAEDIALRQSQLQRGRIGLGISSEAAGAGEGGYVNPEQFSRDRARAMADAQIAANATQAGQQQAANQLQMAQGLFGQGFAGTQQQQQQAANQAQLASSLLGQSGTVTNQQQQQAANQANLAAGLFGQGAAGTAQQQQQLANQISAGQGLYNLGIAPEQFGLNQMQTGFNMGSTQAGLDFNRAQLYGNAMNDYYRTQLGAAQTGQEASLAIPGATRAGQQEAYQRQQTYLGSLQGNQLPYQAMTTPQATVPGSAYALAGLGSGLMNVGLQGMQQAFMPNSQTGVSPYQMQQYQNQANYQLYGNPFEVVAF